LEVEVVVELVIVDVVIAVINVVVNRSFIFSSSWSSWSSRSI